MDNKYKNKRDNEQIEQFKSDLTRQFKDIEHREAASKTEVQEELVKSDKPFHNPTDRNDATIGINQGAITDESEDVELSSDSFRETETCSVVDEEVKAIRRSTNNTTSETETSGIEHNRVTTLDQMSPGTGTPTTLMRCLDVATNKGGVVIVKNVTMTHDSGLCGALYLKELQRLLQCCRIDKSQLIMTYVFLVKVTSLHIEVVKKFQILVIDEKEQTYAKHRLERHNVVISEFSRSKSAKSCTAVSMLQKSVVDTEQYRGRETTGYIMDQVESTKCQQIVVSASKELHIVSNVDQTDCDQLVRYFTWELRNVHCLGVDDTISHTQTLYVEETHKRRFGNEEMLSQKTYHAEDYLQNVTNSPNLDNSKLLFVIDNGLQHSIPMDGFLRKDDYKESHKSQSSSKWKPRVTGGGQGTNICRKNQILRDNGMAIVSGANIVFGRSTVEIHSCGVIMETVELQMYMATSHSVNNDASNHLFNINTVFPMQSDNRTRAVITTGVKIFSDADKTSRGIEDDYATLSTIRAAIGRCIAACVDVSQINRGCVDGPGIRTSRKRYPSSVEQSMSPHSVMDKKLKLYKAEERNQNDVEGVLRRFKRTSLINYTGLYVIMYCIEHQLCGCTNVIDPEFGSSSSDIVPARICSTPITQGGAVSTFLQSPTVADNECSRNNETTTVVVNQTKGDYEHVGDMLHRVVIGACTNAEYSQQTVIIPGSVGVGHFVLTGPNIVPNCSDGGIVSDVKVKGYTLRNPRNTHSWPTNENIVIQLVHKPHVNESGRIDWRENEMVRQIKAPTDADEVKLLQHIDQGCSQTELRKQNNDHVVPVAYLSVKYSQHTVLMGADLRNIDAYVCKLYVPESNWKTILGSNGMRAFISRMKEAFHFDRIAMMLTNNCLLIIVVVVNECRDDFRTIHADVRRRITIGDETKATCVHDSGIYTFHSTQSVNGASIDVDIENKLIPAKTQLPRSDENASELWKARYEKQHVRFVSLETGRAGANILNDNEPNCGDVDGLRTPTSRSSTLVCVKVTMNLQSVMDTYQNTDDTHEKYLAKVGPRVSCPYNSTTQKNYVHDRLSYRMINAFDSDSSSNSYKSPVVIWSNQMKQNTLFSMTHQRNMKQPAVGDPGYTRGVDTIGTENRHRVYNVWTVFPASDIVQNICNDVQTGCVDMLVKLRNRTALTYHAPYIEKKLSLELSYESKQMTSQYYTPPHQMVAIFGHQRTLNTVQGYLQTHPSDIANESVLPSGFVHAKWFQKQGEIRLDIGTGIRRFVIDTFALKYSSSVHVIERIATMLHMFKLSRVQTVEKQRRCVQASRNITYRVENIVCFGPTATPLNMTQTRNNYIQWATDESTDLISKHRDARQFVCQNGVRHAPSNVNINCNQLCHDESRVGMLPKLLNVPFFEANQMSEIYPTCVPHICVSDAIALNVENKKEYSQIHSQQLFQHSYGNDTTSATFASRKCIRQKRALRGKSENKDCFTLTTCNHWESQFEDGGTCTAVFRNEKEIQDDGKTSTMKGCSEDNINPGNTESSSVVKTILYQHTDVVTVADDRAPSRITNTSKKKTFACTHWELNTFISTNHEYGMSVYMYLADNIRLAQTTKRDIRGQIRPNMIPSNTVVCSTICVYSKGVQPCLGYIKNHQQHHAVNTLGMCVKPNITRLTLRLIVLKYSMMFQENHVIREQCVANKAQSRCKHEARSDVHKLNDIILTVIPFSESNVTESNCNDGKEECDGFESNMLSTLGDAKSFHDNGVGHTCYPCCLALNLELELRVGKEGQPKQTNQLLNNNAFQYIPSAAYGVRWPYEQSVDQNTDSVFHSSWYSRRIDIRNDDSTRGFIMTFNQQKTCVVELNRKTTNCRDVDIRPFQKVDGVLLYENGDDSISVYFIRQSRIVEEKADQNQGGGNTFWKFVVYPDKGKLFVYKHWGRNMPVGNVSCMNDKMTDMNKVLENKVIEVIHTSFESVGELNELNTSRKRCDHAFDTKKLILLHTCINEVGFGISRCENHTKTNRECSSGYDVRMSWNVVCTICKMYFYSTRFMRAVFYFGDRKTFIEQCLGFQKIGRMIQIHESNGKVDKIMSVDRRQKNDGTRDLLEMSQRVKSKKEYLVILLPTFSNAFLNEPVVKMTIYRKNTMVKYERYATSNQKLVETVKQLEKQTNGTIENDHDRNHEELSSSHQVNKQTVDNIADYGNQETIKVASEVEQPSQEHAASSRSSVNTDNMISTSGMDVKVIQNESGEASSVSETRLFENTTHQKVVAKVHLQTFPSMENCNKSSQTTDVRCSLDNGHDQEQSVLTPSIAVNSNATDSGSNYDPYDISGITYETRTNKGVCNIIGLGRTFINKSRVQTIDGLKVKDIFEQKLTRTIVVKQSHHDQSNISWKDDTCKQLEVKSSVSECSKVCKCKDTCNCDPNQSPKWLFELRPEHNDVAIRVFPVWRDFSHTDMYDEWKRLISYNGYTGHGNTIYLARHGFFHDAQRGPTSTICYFCHARRDHWLSGDDIAAQHYQDCPLYRSHSNNTPIHSIDQVLTQTDERTNLNNGVGGINFSNIQQRSTGRHRDHEEHLHDGLVLPAPNLITRGRAQLPYNRPIRGPIVDLRQQIVDLGWSNRDLGRTGGRRHGPIVDLRERVVDLGGTNGRRGGVRRQPPPVRHRVRTARDTATRHEEHRRLLDSVQRIANNASPARQRLVCRVVPREAPREGMDTTEVFQPHTDDGVCQHCRDRPAVVQPCGHIVCCKECERRMRICPHC